MSDSKEKTGKSKESAEQAEFRAYCRAWLEENRPPAGDAAVAAGGI